MTIDVIGTIFDIDNSDPENIIVDELDGYHINSTEELPELESFKIEPNYKRRVFFNTETHCYKFTDEQEAYEHLGDRLHGEEEL